MSVIKDQENLVKNGRGREEGKLTDVVEDLVALVENEHLKVVQIECFVLGQMKDTAWGADNDVGRLWALQQLFLLLEGLAAQNALRSNVGDEFGETGEFALNLVGELSSVGKDEDTGRLGALTDAVKRGEDEDGSLAHTRDGLAKDVDAHDGLGDALLLHVTRMLETAINDRLLELGSKNHVLERRGVDTDHVCGSLGGSSCGCGSLSRVAGDGGFLVVEEVNFIVVGELCFYHSIANCLVNCLTNLIYFNGEIIRRSGQRCVTVLKSTRHLIFDSLSD